MYCLNRVVQPKVRKCKKIGKNIASNAKRNLSDKDILSLSFGK